MSAPMVAAGILTAALFGIAAIAAALVWQPSRKAGRTRADS